MIFMLSSLKGTFVNGLSVTGIPIVLQIGSVGAEGVDVGVRVSVGVFVMVAVKA